MINVLKSKRTFQIVLVGSNLVPLMTGVLVAFFGVSVFVPSGDVSADFAAQVRVYAIWFTGVFFLSFWIARNMEISGPVLRIVAILIALAGVSRFITMIDIGEFPTSTVVAGVIELAVLLFIPWHRYVLKNQQAR